MGQDESKKWVNVEKCGKINEGRIEDLFDIDDKGFSFIKSGYVLE